MLGTLRILIRAEQLRLFGGGPVVPVKGHVRHTEDGRPVIVDPSLRHVRPAAELATCLKCGATKRVRVDPGTCAGCGGGSWALPSPRPTAAAEPDPTVEAAAGPPATADSVATPAAPSFATDGPDPVGQMPPALRAELDAALRKYEIDPNQADVVYTQASLIRTEGAGIPTWEEAIDKAARSVKIDTKIGEIVNDASVLDLFGTKGRWMGEGEIRAHFYDKAPIVAMDGVETRIGDIVRALREAGRLEAYYSGSPEDGPYRRLEQLDPEAERVKHLAWATENLVELRRRLRPVAEQRATIRAAWSQMPASVRSRWAEWHPELALDFYQRLNGVRFAEADVRKYGGTFEPLDDDGVPGGHGVGTATAVPEVSPEEDPLARATDGLRAARSLRPGSLVFLPEETFNSAITGRVYRPPRVLQVTSLSTARGEEVPVPPISAQAGRTTINVGQPGYSMRDGSRNGSLWGEDDLVRSLDSGGGKVIAHDVPEAVFAKIAARASDAHRVVPVTVEGERFWYAVGDRRPSVVVDDNGRIVRNGALFAQIGEAVAMVKGSTLDLDATPPYGAPVALEKADKTVDFYHAEEGRRKTGTVLSSGAKGATVHDHETGRTVKVAHGMYWHPEAAAAPTDGPSRPAPPTSQRPAKGAKDKDEAPLSVPGLDAAPAQPERPPSARDPVDEAKPGERPGVRASHQAKLDRVQQTGQRLGVARRRINDHLRAGGTGEAPVHAVLLSAVEQEGADPETLLAARPKPDADGVTIGDARVENPRAAAITKAMRAKSKTWQFTDAAGEQQDVTPTTLDTYCRRVTGGHTVDDLRGFRATAHAVTHLETAGGGKMAHGERVEHLARAHSAAEDAMGDGAGARVDPSVSRAFHQGHRFDEPPDTGDTGHELLTDSERRVVGHLARVHASDPWGLRGGPNAQEDDGDSGGGPKPGSEARAE